MASSLFSGACRAAGISSFGFAPPTGTQATRSALNAFQVGQQGRKGPRCRGEDTLARLDRHARPLQQKAELRHIDIRAVLPRVAVDIGEHAVDRELPAILS